MQFNIIGDRLHSAGLPVNYMQTQHGSGRIEPTLIVVHDTAGSIRPFSARNYLVKNSRQVSAHVVVERDAQVTQLQEFDVKANHAGVSSWNGRQNCNGFSIGIEIASPGKLLRRGSEAVSSCGELWPLDRCVEITSEAHDGKALWLPYADQQLAVVFGICQALVQRYPTIIGIVGHYEISPGRKIDCGPQFPLDQLRELVADRRPPNPEMVREVQVRLAHLGYHPGGLDGIAGPMTRSAVRDFQEQNGLLTDSVMDTRTIKALFDPAAKEFPRASREEISKGEVSKGRDAAVIKRTVEGVALTQIWSEAGASSPPPVPEPHTWGASVDAADTALRKVETGKEVASRASDILSWVQTPRGMQLLIVLAMLSVVWFLAHRIEWRRWRDFVAGLFVGGR